MTKAQIIETIRGHLSGGSATGDILHKIDARRLELYVAAAYQDVIFEVFKKNAEGLSLYAKTFTGVAVALDAVTGAYTCAIPAAIIQLPGVAGAIRRVGFDDGTDLVFVPLEADLMESIKMLDAGNYTVNPTIGYCLRGVNSLEFMNFPAASAALTLRIDAVIAFTEYVSDEEVYLPSGQVNVLLNGVIGLLTGRKAVDLENINAEQINE